MLHLGLPSVEGGLMSEFLNRTCGLMAGGAAGLGLRSAGWCLLFQSGARLAGLPGHVCRGPISIWYAQCSLEEHRQHRHTQGEGAGRGLRSGAKSR